MAIDPKKFNTEQRRIDLAEKILIGEMNQNELAEYYGVGPSTITADKKSKEFLSARNGPLIAASLKTIYEAAKNGNLQAAFHISDKLCIMKPDEETGASNPALDMLAKIYGAPSEMETLRCELTETKSELDEIKRRLSALNGQGAEILKDIETPVDNDRS